MSERDSLSVLGLLVLIALGSAGASWEAGRRFERERHRCAPSMSRIDGSDECERRLAECWYANTSAVLAVDEIARQEEGCRRFGDLGVGPGVRR